MEDANLVGEQTETRWIPVEMAAALGWKENPKSHDINAVVDSIAKYGFRDKPAFDANLHNINGGKGAIIYGNGRIEALMWMYKQKRDVPRGIKVDKETGKWYVPIEYGLDAKNEEQAMAFAIDHNSLTLMGGDLSLSESVKIYDEAALIDILQTVYNAEEVSISFDPADLQSLIDNITNDSQDSDDDEGAGDEEDLPEKYLVVIECENEQNQLELLERFEKEGLRCRALLS